MERVHKIFLLNIVKQETKRVEKKLSKKKEPSPFEDIGGIEYLDALNNLKDVLKKEVNAEISETDIRALHLVVKEITK